MRQRNVCSHCNEQLGHSWMRDIHWAGMVCLTCYGTGGRFDHWVANLMRRFIAVLKWREALGGNQP